MSSQPEAKRAKISPDVGTIACRLNELVRGDLEKVARAGITESPAALNLAKTLISRQKAACYIASAVMKISTRTILGTQTVLWKATMIQME